MVVALLATEDIIKITQSCLKNVILVQVVIQQTAMVPKGLMTVDMVSPQKSLFYNSGWQLVYHNPQLVITMTSLTCIYTFYRYNNRPNGHFIYFKCQHIKLKLMAKHTA